MILRACILFLLLLNFNAHTQIPFHDGFESGNFISGGWTVSGNSAISTINPAQGIYCVEGPGNWGIVKTLNSINASVLTVEFKVKASQVNTTCMIFRIKDTLGNTSVGTFFDNLGYINGVNGPGTIGVVPLFAYTADTWYSFRFELDMNTNQYDLYIDNVLHCNDYNFFSSGFTDPYLFTWSSVATTGTAWIDDIHIYAGTVNQSDILSVDNTEFILINSGSALKVKTSDSKNLTACIRNISGQTIYKNTIRNDQLIDLTYFQPGIYFASWIENSKVHIFKFLKEKN
jgi:hypothetical protein